MRPHDIEFEFVDRTFNNSFILNAPLPPSHLRIDFIRLSEDKVLVPITMELEDQDFQEWQKQTQSGRDHIVVCGAVTNLQGRLLAEFEHMITTADSVETLGPGTARRITWQKILVLPPGQELVLHWSLKDANRRDIIPDTHRFLVPKFTGEELQASSIILANSVYAIPPKAPDPMAPLQQIQDPFVIGDLKVMPNVKAEYAAGQHLIAYLQVYNAAPVGSTSFAADEAAYPAYPYKKICRFDVTVNDAFGMRHFKAVDDFDRQLEKFPLFQEPFPRGSLRGFYPP